MVRALWPFKSIWLIVAWASCSLSLHATDSGDSDPEVMAIKAARILPRDMGVTITRYPQTQEALISTYVNSASKDLATDCKIDAILIARTVMQAASQTVRVRVRFYNPAQYNYREVVVTKPEIAAFAQGSVSKQELLASLELTSHSTAKAPASQATTPASTKSLQTGAANQSARLLVFKDKGLTFCYPKAWGYKEMKNQFGDFVELISQRNSWCSIMIRLQKDASAQETADNDNRYFWKSHQRKILSTKTIVFGGKENIPGIAILLKDESNSADPRRFEKHIYFGAPGKIYSISTRFCMDDYTAVNADLDSILSSISCD